MQVEVEIKQTKYLVGVMHFIFVSFRIRKNRRKRTTDSQPVK